MNSIPAKLISLLISASVSLGSPISVLAQNLDEEIQKPAIATSTQDDALEAADEAEEHRAVEDNDGVTYADVLKDPDNIDLNYRWAKTQVANGDIKGASITLERILMVDPALPKIRLFYGIVLYRLGNLQEALRELEAILALPMTSSLKNEVKAYIARIKKKMRSTNWTASTGIGFQYDTNHAASPATGRRLFAGIPITLLTGQRQEDFSYLFLLGMGVEHDLGTQAGHKLFANLNYYRAEQILLNTLDVQVYHWNLGAKLNGGRYGQFKISTPFDHLRLSEETYLRTYGLRLEWDRTLNNKLSLFTQLQGSKHDYVKTTDIPTATQRTGDHYRIDYGLHYNLRPNQRLTAGLGFTSQNARVESNAYDRHKIQLKHAWLLGKSRFLLSGVTLHLDKYREPDTAISPRDREDTTFRVGSTFGMPLGAVWAPLKDVLWTFTYEYFHAGSSLINYAYTNNKVSTLFTYRWES